MRHCPKVAALELVYSLAVQATSQVPHTFTVSRRVDWPAFTVVGNKARNYAKGSVADIGEWSVN